jgi:hypothetical protein
MNDTICVADSNDGGKLKCSVDRKLRVIGSQEKFSDWGTDGLMGFSRLN